MMTALVMLATTSLFFNVAVILLLLDAKDELITLQYRIAAIYQKEFQDADSRKEI